MTEEDLNRLEKAWADYLGYPDPATKEPLLAELRKSLPDLIAAGRAALPGAAKA